MEECICSKGVVQMGRGDYKVFVYEIVGSHFRLYCLPLYILFIFAAFSLNATKNDQ